jgi:hypothetical protein
MGETTHAGFLLDDLGVQYGYRIILKWILKKML